MKKSLLHRTAITLLLSTLAFPVNAHKLADSAVVSTIKVSPGIYILMAPRGSNMVLLLDDRGALLVDSHLQEVGESLVRAIARITDRDVKYLVNTHWHFDHAGNNYIFGERGASIVAHKNARLRLEKGQYIKALGRDVPPAPESALPVITFGEELSLHWADELLSVVHVEQAHTDGDAIIYFQKSNMVHMGDIYFTNMYPFIDATSGGSLNGVISAVDRVLEVIDEKTIVIPGHGELSNKAELLHYRNMLSTVNSRIESMKNKGMLLSEVLVEKPTAEFDSQYGFLYLRPDDWVSIIFNTP